MINNILNKLILTGLLLPSLSIANNQPEQNQVVESQDSKKTTEAETEHNEYANRSKLSLWAEYMTARGEIALENFKERIEPITTQISDGLNNGYLWIKKNPKKTVVGIAVLILAIIAAKKTKNAPDNVINQTAEQKQRLEKKLDEFKARQKHLETKSTISVPAAPTSIIPSNNPGYQSIYGDVGNMMQPVADDLAANNPYKVVINQERQ